MYLLMIVSTALATSVSFVVRMLGLNFWFSFIMTSAVVDVVVLYLSQDYFFLIANPVSIFENSRVIFLCLTGCMIAELLIMATELIVHLRQEQ